MIRTIIIDDEPYSCEALAILLEKCCPEIKIEAICHSAEEALHLLAVKKFELMFLDIEMPRINGFQMLEQLPCVDFQLIFTTSFDQYAIKAIRFSALDYLLKPIDREELKAAVKKATDRLQPALPSQLEILLQKLHFPAHRVSRIALPTLEGLQLISVNDIISCTASSNYTIFALKDNQKLTVSRTLKEIEEMLEEHNFLRVHHSYLVNLNEIKKYIKGEGGLLIMSDGSSIDVSRSKKELLLKRIQPPK